MLAGQALPQPLNTFVEPVGAILVFAVPAFLLGRLETRASLELADHRHAGNPTCG